MQCLHIFSQGSYYPSLPSPLPVILRKKVTWEGFYAYLQSFSSLHTFHERYPEDLKHPDGTIAQRFMQTLWAEMDKLDKVSSASTEGSGSPVSVHKEEVNEDGEVEIEVAISTGLGKAPIDWGTNLKAKYSHMAVLPRLHSICVYAVNSIAPVSARRLVLQRIRCSFLIPRQKWRLNGITDHLVGIVYFYRHLK